VTATDWFGKAATATSGAFLVGQPIGTVLSLTSVSPTASEPGAPRALTLEGTGFGEGLAVEIDGESAVDVEVLGPTSATATVLAPALPGVYDVWAHQGAATAVLEQAFAVVAPGCPAGACGPCDSDAECIEGKICTQDTCTGGACLHDPMAECCDLLGGCDVCASVGDLDGDGTTNVTDVQCHLLLLLTTLEGADTGDLGCIVGPLSTANLNCDGALSIVDVVIGIFATLGIPLSPSLDMNANQCADACETATCGDGACAWPEDCRVCPADCGPCEGGCTTPHATPGCEDPATQDCVCNSHPTCCYALSTWDETCAAKAATCAP
jgi:hypothetical protein